MQIESHDPEIVLAGGRDGNFLDRIYFGILTGPVDGHSRGIVLARFDEVIVRQLTNSPESSAAT